MPRACGWRSAAMPKTTSRASSTRCGAPTAETDSTYRLAPALPRMRASPAVPARRSLGTKRDRPSRRRARARLNVWNGKPLGSVLYGAGVITAAGRVSSMLHRLASEDQWPFGTLSRFRLRRAEQLTLPAPSRVCRRRQAGATGALGQPGVARPAHAGGAHAQPLGRRRCCGALGARQHPDHRAFRGFRATQHLSGHRMCNQERRCRCSTCSLESRV